MKMGTTNFVLPVNNEKFFKDIDHFCNYGVKKPCSSRVYGFTQDGMYTMTTIGDTITSKMCAGECKRGEQLKRL